MRLPRTRSKHTQVKSSGILKFIQKSDFFFQSEHCVKNVPSIDPEMLLEIQWGPRKDLQDVHQEKRRALIQRSSCRVEEIKAKRALDKTQPEIRAPSEAREKSKAKQSQPKTKLEAQHKTKGGQAEPHQTTEKSAFNKQKKPTLPPPGILSGPQVRAVCRDICT